MYNSFDPADSLTRLRAGMIGRDAMLTTPFGERLMVYADYTASGRALRQVDDQIDRLSAAYANPHTVDSATGRASGDWLHQAEAVIREAVHAGPQDCLIACSAGATGAIHKLQEILGLAIAPASRDRMVSAIADRLGAGGRQVVTDALAASRPVVFIGPYEHHSNELSWRESLAEVVTIGLTADGGIDMAQLESELRDPRWLGRRRIGAFSAASNVTGIKSDVIALARLLHAHDAILCLDCAASAPYLQIDMHPASEPEAWIDAVYFSPHKFVGGPGACGILLFNEALYRRDLPPTQSAGGTVRYVTKTGHDFIEAIEPRERAGTPGVPQIVRAALALRAQAEIGHEQIARLEHEALARAMSHWGQNPRIDILGPADPERRIGIVSFNILDTQGAILHPRLVTCLLNDLFGIQSRAGCSCAGPYGHELLGIDAAQSEVIREAVLLGQAGLRPGWCRVSLHWAMETEEIEFLIDAVDWIAAHGARIASLYAYDSASGRWSWRGEAVAPLGGFPGRLLDDGQAERSGPPLDRAACFAAAMAAANAAIAVLPSGDADLTLAGHY
ncbi:aminotransferase class V-fold PLP-dependent enzyme [uncultured Maricaulis sp.]|uniref:aminotransferase class V-fold PLP-dependent enzyme n=1 Tax=uncultured Maricaulis sp. TaxID=174710 RepID=UPI0030D82ABF|tara:strand:- start:3967 stop:5649 length:1683 start_codon:yes stop_codon:yes gene_type:complete